jgi:hypothetical protein
MAPGRREKEKQMETTTEGTKTSEPQTAQDPSPQESGQKSPYLTQAQGGILDTGEGGYQYLTEGVPEKGLFTIVGGYLDEEGVVHREVELRSMCGHEEDLLGNQSVPVTQRLSGIMAACTNRIGTIVDRGQISKAVNALPTGSRTHLLISLRRTSHWKRTKDIYDMEVRCPSSRCGQVGSYKVDLSDLEVWEMADPTKRQFDLELDEVKETALWKIPTGAEDQVLAVIAESPANEAEILSYMIMVRLVSVGGNRVELGVPDFLDANHKKLKLSRKAKELLLWTKNLPVADRETFRESFDLNEPGVDTDLDFQCKFCRQDFRGNLNVSQASFFFPSATSRRSKRRSSI